MKTRILIGLLVPAVCWVALRAATLGDGDAVPSVPAVQGDAKPFGLESLAGKYSAVTNCSSSNCHGNGSKGNEYAIWAGDDPHRKAHLVLFNEVSTRIQKNLKAALPAPQDPLCLKCHAVDQDKHYHGELIPGHGLSEGVSCDACHGPSQAWLGEHYRDDWKHLSDREKYDRYGFKQTKDLVARTLACAQCHVGARDREVNHDLIAAGHPRLAFEAARFHFTQNYPKHWKERIPNPAFEIRLWQIGQVVTLRQSLDLFAARAERAAAKQAPWPELSEYSCFSCHQDVTGSKNRSAYGERDGRLPGRAGWQIWTLGVWNLPIGGPPLEALHKLMANDVVDPTAAAALARKAMQALDTQLASIQQLEGNNAEYFKGVVNNFLNRAIPLTHDKQKLRDTDWDFLAQHTLALAAVAHAMGDDAKDWRPLVGQLQAALAFPPDAGGRRIDSPRDYDAKTVLELFRALDAQLNAGGGR